MAKEEAKKKVEDEVVAVDEEVLDEAELNEEEPSLEEDMEDIEEDVEALEADFNARREAEDDMVRTYLREVGKVDLLTIEEERTLAAKIKAGDKRAKDMMAEAYRLTRVDMSEAEKTQFYTKYIKPMHLIISENGDISIALKKR